MKSKSKSPIQKYKNWIGMGLVLVVFVVVLLIAGKPSQPKGKPTEKKETSERTSKTRTRGERSTKSKKRSSREERMAEKAKKKLEKARRREERKQARASGKERSTRSEKSRESRSGSRVRTEPAYVVKGIFTDENGEKYALIGERRARSGDVVAGRRIREVQTDRVEVEYGGSNYEVRVGNSLF